MDEHSENIFECETLRDEEPAPLQRDALVGELLGARYLVARKLGEGGFGAVYLATDEKMASRNVVIKVLHKGEIANEWSVKRFQQEIEALARVDHPAIVGIYDIGETSDATPYIVMQYVEGLNLRAVIGSGAMDLRRIANIVRQTGRALTAAHAKGILHRDLKPENIMLQQLNDEDEQVKIIDFGVAKVKNSKIALNTASDQAVGTIAYMSPEQLQAEPLTFASDIYSMGVIAYELLVGHRPLNPASIYQLLDMQRACIDAKPSTLRHDVSPLADRAILKALSFKPEDRYASASEFGDVLADALADTSEETLLRTQRAPLASIAEERAENVPVTAHVLFMDIVSYSQLLMDQQTSRLRRLQETVLSTEECRAVFDPQRCIRLPTGDGMALVFFGGEPETALKAAVQISTALRTYPEIELRMGVHSGLVYRVADINTNLNVAGGGINMAQRVMDCGDTGHILVSKRVADDLGQLSRWASCLHDLGEAEVKHGVRIHIYNVYGDGFGNPAVPTKLAKPAAKLNYRLMAIALVSVFVVGLVLAGWYLTRQRAEPSHPRETISGAPAEPQQSLTYWLTVQSRNGKTFGKEFQSSGNEIFNTGSRFKFNIRSEQQGALYLLSEGRGENGENVYDILFPTPRQGGKANLEAQQVWQSSWNFFVENTGVEKLWILWSAQPLAELDSMFSDASKAEGRINAAGVEKLRKYLAQYETNPPKIVPLKEKDITEIHSSGNLLVSRIELSHKAY